MKDNIFTLLDPITKKKTISMTYFKKQKKKNLKRLIIK